MLVCIAKRAFGFWSRINGSFRPFDGLIITYVILRRRFISIYMALVRGTHKSSSLLFIDIEIIFVIVNR